VRKIRKQGAAAGREWGTYHAEAEEYVQLLGMARTTPEEKKKEATKLIEGLERLPTMPDFESEQHIAAYAAGFEKGYESGAASARANQQVRGVTVAAILMAITKDRKMSLPRPKYGRWTGTPGHSTFVLSSYAKKRFGILAGEVSKVKYKHGIADFSAVAKSIKGQQRSLRVPGLTYNRSKDTQLTIKALAKEWSMSEKAVADYLSKQGLRIHHYKPGFIQLVPKKYHRLYHEGGVKWAKLIGIATAVGITGTIDRLLAGDYDVW
jgi:hypothetical protein